MSKTTVTVQSICDVMDDWAPPALAYDWDRSGLALGDPQRAVARVLTCLTVTPAAVKAARKARAQMIVSHHPLIWEPLRHLRAENATARLCLELAQAEIACFSAHTNLDVVPDGVNCVLAKQIGLRDLRALIPVKQAVQLKLVTFVPESHLAAVRDAVSAAGAGKIGEYTHCSFSSPGVGTFTPSPKADPYSGEVGVLNEEPERRFETLFPKARLGSVLRALAEAHPYEEAPYDLCVLENRDRSIGLGLAGEVPKAMTLRAFAELVRIELGLSYVRMIGDGRRKVRRVGVIGGSGGGQIAEVPGGIDVLVTGDVKYHEALEALDRGLCVIDAGHAGTELGIVPAMAAYLRKRLAVKVSTYMEPEILQLVSETT
jgi:dinuclear metal center YbgI/SA1388 family protein